MKTKPAIACGGACRLAPVHIITSLLLMVALCGANLASAQSQGPLLAGGAGLDYNAPWGGPSAKSSKPTPSGPAPSTQPPATVQPGALSTAPPTLRPPKSTKNEVSVSGDLTMGQGQVTLPLGYSLRETLGGVANVPVSAFSANRSSIYFGGTVSYSYGQAWYIDLSFAHGESSGQQAIDTGWLGPMNSDFKITDDWLQAYVRYTFPGLRGKRLSAYLRAGGSFVQADLKDDASSPAFGRYTQTDKTQDFLGNVGFGLGYSLYSTRRARLGLQFEGEGFFGVRTQDSLENLSADEGLTFLSTRIDNTLYGGIGRVTVRYEYRLGRSGLFKVFADAGGQMRYTLVSYPGAGSSTELLWGPYVKVGVRYAF